MRLLLIFALTVKEYFWSAVSLPMLTVATTLVFGAINLRGMAAALKVITVMNLIELAVLITVGAADSRSPCAVPGLRQLPV